jgi:2-aminoadipate transaminase
MLHLDRSISIPLYRQVVDQIADLIHRGVLAPNTRLPTVRALAFENGLTRLTVQTAYNELQSQGLIDSYVGRGTFVANHMERSAKIASPPARFPQPVALTNQGLLSGLEQLFEQTNLISFAKAHPDPQTFPLREFRRALNESIADPNLLGYGPAQGDALLREQVSRLLLDREISIPPEQVLITDGAQHAIDLIFRTLARPDDVIVVEEPTYPGIFEIVAQYGLQVISVEMDHEGMKPDALEAVCSAYQARFLYIMPTFQNPTGIEYSESRRDSILWIAREHNLLIVEDDVFSALAYDHKPLPAWKSLDKDNRILFVTSFSKGFMPGLRLGLIGTVDPHLSLLTLARQTSSLNSSPLMQHALALYLQRGNWGIHLQAARDLYRARRDAMDDALERFLPMCHWTSPHGGFSIWVALPQEINEAEIVQAAIQSGINVTPGQSFFLPPYPSGFLRLCFGTQTPDQIRQGIKILGNVVADYLNRYQKLIARTRREDTPLV